MNESESEIHQRSTDLDQEIYTRRRILVGLCCVALLMVCVFAVQALSPDSAPRSTSPANDQGELTPSTPQDPLLTTTVSPEITITTT
jgi:hypothetical protein